MPPRTGAQRTGDVAKGLAAIFTLVGIVAGVPIGLYRFGGQWLPKTVPTLDQAREALSRPVSDDAMLTGLTLVCWVLWALFTLAVTFEILSWSGHAAGPATRRRSGPPGRAHGKPRLAVPGLQNAAASLVMSALLVLPTAGAASASSSPASPAPMALQMPDQVAAPPTSPGPAPTPAAPAAPQATERVTVKRGDSPWGIAERHLGEGERWRDLRHDDGRLLANREIIHPGQVLLVPVTPTPTATPAAAAAASAEAVEPATTVVVRPGDSLWEIAEDNLGDGEQYQGIWTANRGRVMDDGARFRDPDLIRPGWKLTVPGLGYTPPASATTPPPAPPAATAAPPPAPPAAAPANPPAAPATDRPEAVPSAESPAGSAGTAVAPPTTIWPPPSTVTAPPSTATAPPPTSAPAPPAGPLGDPAAPEPPVAERPNPASARAKDSSGRVAPLPIGLATAGLAGAAITGLVARRRRGQIGRRRTGRRPPLPTGERARMEAAVRTGADPAGAALLADALAVVAAAVDVDGAGLPEILGAHLIGPSAARVELLLASSADEVPGPFTPSDDGLRWTATSADVLGLVDPLERTVSPTPALVTLGVSDAGALLVNLEAIGLLALEGDRERAVGVLRRMAFELGAAPLVGALHLILAGLPEVSGLDDHVETVATLHDALDRATRLVGHRREELAAAGAPSAAAARSAGMAGDTWPPVVILAAGAEQEGLARAVEATTGSASNGVVVVVAANHTGARWALDLDGDQVDVGPLGLSVDPQPGTTNSPTRLLGFSRDEATAVSEVLETSLREDDIAADEAPYGLDDDGWGWPTPADIDDIPDTHGTLDIRDSVVDARTGNQLHLVTTDDPEPKFDICIQVLGPIEVHGAGTFTRGKGRELTVALAFNRRGVTTAQLDELLWPGRPVPTGTRNSTVSTARAALRAHTEANLLHYGADGGGEARYRLDATVGTDWDRFRWLTRTATGPDAADRLTQALELVRGEPFGAPTTGWAWAQPHITEIVCAVGDVAHILAQWRLDALDLHRATAAARAGLLASPWDQRLHADLMQIADAAGNPAGVKAIWNELLSRFDDEDQIRPDVASVYQRCRNRKEQAT